MANICETSISVIGLEESSETFVKTLSKAMFGIDLDDMDVEKWDNYRCEGGKLYNTFHLTNPETGEKRVVRRELNGKADTSKCEEGKYYCLGTYDLDTDTTNLEEISPETWYQKIIKEAENSSYAPLYVLVPKPFAKCGVSVPRFSVHTKWVPPYEQVMTASEAFPHLLFDARWFIDDGPSGEFVLKGGKLLERTESEASWYLFDQLKYPSMSLLPKYMPLTLAQRGAAAVDDAIGLVKSLHYVIHDPRFAESRYQPLRDQRKFEETRQTLDALLAYMEEAAKSLTFEAVFLPDMTDAGTEVRNEEEDLKLMNVEEVRP
jgi:hypothetical protein